MSLFTNTEILSQWEKPAQLAFDPCFKDDLEYTESTAVSYLLVKEALIKGVDFDLLLPATSSRGSISLYGRASALETKWLKKFRKQVPNFKNSYTTIFTNRTSRQIPTAQIGLYVSIVRAELGI